MIKTPFIAGASVADIASAEGGYNYYGYVRTDGSWVIQRENVAETEYRYAIGGAVDYPTSWTARSSQNYLRPDQLPFPFGTAQ